MLKPVALYPDSSRKNGFLVMCEVLMPDGTPHVTNTRSTVGKMDDLWIGLEQEYFFYQDGRPLGFPQKATRSAGSVLHRDRLQQRR